MATGGQTGGTSTTSRSAAALVEAAKALLAERPPTAIPGRELAERAGVNYGLVHRHFGSKSEVLGRALDELIAEFASAGFDDDGLPIPLCLAAHERLCRALTHVVLDAAGFRQYRHSAPVLQRCLAGVRSQRRDLDDDESAVVAGLALSIETGVPIHRPVLARAVGLRPADPAIDHLVGRWLAGLYRGFGPLGCTPVAGPSPPARGPRNASGDVADALAAVAVDGPPDDGERSAEVRLLAAGADLLADRAPSAISGRQLARAAGVNYGLIHHYFGSKDEVLRHSLQLHRDRFFASQSGPHWSPRFFSVCDHPGYVRAMTWSALDPALGGSDQRFPVTEQLIARLVLPRTPPAAELATRVAVYVAVAAQMAWALYLPVLQRGLGRDPRSLEPMAASLLRELLLHPMRGVAAPR